MLLLCFRMKTAGLLFIVSMSLCAESEHRNEADHLTRCSNLTLVLDNWKFAIMTQVKDLLLHDHGTVLPDYGRITPLSGALSDLYTEFNALKQRLADLTSRFDGVEAFVDEVRVGRKPRPPGGAPPPRRTRVVVRRIHKPAASRD